MNLYQNANYTSEYLDKLTQLNQESKTPGLFNHFQADGKGKSARYHFSKNTYAKSPKQFYTNLNENNHNWMTLNTINPKMKSEHRHDTDVNNLLANYLDIDCLQNGVKPEEFMERYKQYMKQPHKHPIPQPTALFKSGHGVYMIYLYKHPVSLGNKLTDAKKDALKQWKLTDRSLAKYVNIQTRRWYGKDLADIHSTNPARILRMANTVNVKYKDPSNKFTKPALCYIMNYSGKTYDYGKLKSYILTNYTPYFDAKYRKTIKPLNTKINTAGAIWSKIKTAQTNAQHKDLSDSSSILDAYQNRYQYGTYHPKNPKNAYKAYNFTALDYLADHHIEWDYMPDGVNIYVPDQKGLYHNGGDLSSVVITQTMNHKYDPKTHTFTAPDPSRSFTQINRESGKWDVVTGKGLNDLTKIVMLHHGIFDKKEATRIANQWKKHYAEEGHTKSAFPWQKYGKPGSSIHKGKAIKNPATTSHKSKKELYQTAFKGRILRSFYKLVQSNEKRNAGSLDTKARSYNSAYKFTQKNIIDNDIARNYLVHRRGLKLSTVNALINRGLVRGIKGFDDRPNAQQIKADYDNFRKYKQNKHSNKKEISALKDKINKLSNEQRKTYKIYQKNKSKQLMSKMVKDNSQIEAMNKQITHIKAPVTKFTEDVKSAKFGAPMVEFIQREPRTASEAHRITTPNSNERDTLLDDIRLQMNPKYVPKDDKQMEVPSGADYIGLSPTKDTYTDKAGQQHQIYNTQKLPNKSGKLVKDKLVDKNGDSNYGFNFRNGKGTNKLYVYEDPIDAISHYEAQVQYYQHLKKTQPQNKEAIHKAHEAFANSTHLSLSGSGSKVGSIQHFINKQFAMGHDYQHIICAFDNDTAGYAATQNILSSFGNRLKYSQNKDNNIRQVTAAIPISRNRKKGQLTSRFDATLPNSTFNKDWNDMTQSVTFKHYKFPRPDVTLNANQYSSQNIDNMYAEMKTANQQKGLSQNTKFDMEKADMAIHLAGKIDSNTNKGTEKINANNPRINAIVKTEQSMSKPAKSVFQQYMESVGSTIAPQELSQYSTQSLQKRHINNDFLQSNRAKEVLNEPYNKPKLYQDINNTMSQLKDDKERRLFATVIQANASLENRKAYHYLHGTPQGRSQYRHIRHFAPKPEYKTNEITAQQQNKLDTLDKLTCFNKIRSQYPKDYNKVLQIGQDIQQLNNAKSTSHNLQARKILVNSKDIADANLHNQSAYTPNELQPKNVLQPIVKKINTTNINLNKKFRNYHKHQYRGNHYNHKNILKDIPEQNRYDYAYVIKEAYMERYDAKHKLNHQKTAYKHYNKLPQDYQHKVRTHLMDLESHNSHQLANESWQATQYTKKHYLQNSHRSHKYLFSDIPKENRYNYASIIKDTYMEHFYPKYSKTYSQKAYQNYSKLPKQYQHKIIKHLNDLEKHNPKRLKAESWQAHKYLSHKSAEVKKSLSSIPVHKSKYHYKYKQNQQYPYKRHYYRQKPTNYRNKDRYIKHNGFGIK